MSITSGPPWEQPGTWQHLVPRPVEETRPQAEARSSVPPHRVLLGLILLVQGVMMASLVRSNTAFGDEATYLREGRLEWAHWLHGAPLVAIHNSGSPYIYPPIGAIASALGGLEGARLLSLGFMVGVTGLVYLTASHLTGRTAALWAAAMTGACEPVLRLAFATYDPLACLLTVGALYLAVRPSDGRQRVTLAVASGLCLGVAALTAVSFGAYIPAVVAVTLCGRAVQEGWRKAQAVAGIQSAVVVFGAVAGLSVSHLWSSAAGSTISRHRGLGYSVASVLKSAWGWEGLIVCAAVAGTFLAFAGYGRRDPRGWLMASCTVSACIVPAYQAYIGSAWSLDKHLSAGAGLAAIASGYAASRAVARAGRQWAVPVAAAALMVYPAVSGWIAADTMFSAWANTTAVTTALSAYNGQQVLVAGPVNPTIFEYYLPGETFVLSGPASAAAIDAGRYAAVVTDLNAEGLADPRQVLPSALTRGKGLAAQVIAIAGGKLVGVLRSSHRYVIADVIPYRTTSTTDASGVFVLWKRAAR